MKKTNTPDEADMNSLDGEIMDIFIKAYSMDINSGEYFEQIKALIAKEADKARLDEAQWWVTAGNDGDAKGLRLAQLMGTADKEQA